MNRRDHLKQLGLMGLLPFVSGWLPMDKQIITRNIPGTSESLPVIGTGTWETFDIAENMTAELAQVKKVLQVLVSEGGRVVDTSPMYGYSEQNVGQLSESLGINQKLFIATKVWTSGKEKGVEQMNTSMKLLRRSTIDLMQIHNLVDWETHIKTLREWKEAGKIRYIGITHYRKPAYADLEYIMLNEPIDFLQVNYNIAETEAAQRLLPLAKERNIGVIISQPFGYGKLFQRVNNRKLPGLAKELGCDTWAQFFLKYVVSHPAVTCAIPGTGKPEHMRDNMQAAFGVMPDENQRKEMEKLI